MCLCLDLGFAGNLVRTLTDTDFGAKRPRLSDLWMCWRAVALFVDSFVCLCRVPASCFRARSLCPSLSQFFEGLSGLVFTCARGGSAGQQTARRLVKETMSTKLHTVKMVVSASQHNCDSEKMMRCEAGKIDGGGTEDLDASGLGFSKNGMTTRNKSNSTSFQEILSDASSPRSSGTRKKRLSDDGYNSCSSFERSQSKGSTSKMSGIAPLATSTPRKMSVQVRRTSDDAFEDSSSISRNGLQLSSNPRSKMVKLSKSMHRMTLEAPASQKRFDDFGLDVDDNGPFQRSKSGLDTKRAVRKMGGRADKIVHERYGERGTNKCSEKAGPSGLCKQSNQLAAAHRPTTPRSKTSLDILPRPVFEETINPNATPTPPTATEKSHSSTSPSFRERYSVRKLVSESSVNKIYLGVNRATHQEVIIKKLVKCQESLNELVFTKAASKISPKYCLPILYSEKTASSYVMVLPKFGVSLYDFMCNRQETLKVAEAQKIFKKVLKVLVKLQQYQIFHYDVKEENILIDPETLEIKLIDFGGAAQAMPERFTGSFEFAAPEMFMKQRWKASGYESRCDVWSFGVSLYSAVCGVTPYEGIDEVFEAKFKQRETFSVGGELPDDLADVLQATLVPDFRRRVSFRDLLENFEFFR